MFNFSYIKYKGQTLYSRVTLHQRFHEKNVVHLMLVNFNIAVFECWNKVILFLRKLSHIVFMYV